MFKEPTIDEYGRQICPMNHKGEPCNNILTVTGCWYYNNRFHTDRFSFKCDKCHCSSWNGTAEETELHQDGIEAAKKDKQVQEAKQKVVDYKNKILIK